ncbi:MAG: Ig-like domain-containing protein, partial [Gemmatimonadales bacterium]
MTIRLRTLLPGALGALLLACGGGTQPDPPPPPPPPPPPTPVATVVVTPGQTGLVVGQTRQFSAATLDGSGNALSGRTVTWQSAPTSVATISSSGLATAVTAGAATITATSEGRAGTASVSVSEGGVVGSTGGTVTAAGGKVTIEVPAGAVAQNVGISVAPLGAVPGGLPDGVFAAAGTGYAFGPAGTTFSTPVRVTIEYPAGQLPPWALPGDVGVYRFDGSAWHALGDLQVDTVARTVSATTTGFSDFAITTTTPGFALSPSPASVNYAQRSALFTAAVGEHDPGLFQYEWLSTGQSGDVNAQIDNTAQYTATAAVIPVGDLDLVGVRVRAALFEGGPVVLLGEAVATVNSNLGLTIELTPFSTVAEFGESKTFRARILAADGTEQQGERTFEWTATENAGTLDLADVGPQSSPTAVYTASLAGDQVPNPPRGDRIEVRAVVQEIVEVGTLFSPRHEVITRELAKTEAFVEVGPNTFAGTFQIATEPTPAGACVFVYIFGPKVEGATSYEIIADHFNDPGGRGTEYRRTFTAATGTEFDDVQDAGANFRIALAGGCNTTPEGIQSRQQT